MSREFTLHHSGNTIKYTIEKRQRRSISIIVSKNGDVKVRVPLFMSYNQAQEFVETKSASIFKNIDRVKSRANESPALSYISGDVVSLLGSKYRLEVKLVTSNEDVRVEGDMICVYTTDTRRVRVLLMNFYNKQAVTHIKEPLALLCKEFAAKEGVSPTKLELKFIRSYWGQCSSKRVIRFNVELVRMDMQLIEYVIMHELCHMVHMNHSKSFYALLESYMPDHRERQKRLKSTYQIVLS